MPVCFVNNDCVVLAKRGNTLCVDCKYRFQGRLDNGRKLRVSTVPLSVPTRRVVFQSFREFDDSVVVRKAVCKRKRVGIGKPEEYLRL